MQARVHLNGIQGAHQQRPAEADSEGCAPTLEVYKERSEVPALILAFRLHLD